MEMVSCRGCAREIHQSATACPGCGATPAVLSAMNAGRSIFKLVGLWLLYSVGCWFVSMFLTGVVAGVIAGGSAPPNVAAYGEQMGQLLNGPILLASIVLVAVLTVYGKLPGTAKPAATRFS